MPSNVILLRRETVAFTIPAEALLQHHTDLSGIGYGFVVLATFDLESQVEPPVLPGFELMLALLREATMVVRRGHIRRRHDGRQRAHHARGV